MENNTSITFYMALSDEEFEHLKVLDNLYGAKIESDRRENEIRRNFLGR